MANDINKVILVGRLTADPQLSTTPTGSHLCKFTLASNRTIFVKDGDNKEEAGFFQCIAWGKLAEVVSKYAQKGRRVGVDGSLRFSAWDNAEGKRQSKVEIYVENFQFLDVNNNQKPNNDNIGEPSSEAEAGYSFQEPFEDNIPF